MLAQAQKVIFLSYFARASVATESNSVKIQMAIIKPKNFWHFYNLISEVLRFKQF